MTTPWTPTDADRADVEEQARPVRDDEPGEEETTPAAGWEADDADAVEQAREVGFPDDEEERG